MTAAVDVAIVGSGPAGLSAAARAAARGLSHVLLERTDRLADTIFRYQRGKHVMATPNALALRSDIAFEAGRREAILQTWADQAASLGIDVRLNSEVTAVSGRRGAFLLTFGDGARVTAGAVVLAVGAQGDPNRLRIPGADDPRLQYHLDDPGAFTHETIIVVGGGDTAIENALGLADPELANAVTLLNRGEGFVRAKAANVARLEEARARGRLDYVNEATPTRLSGGAMLVDARSGELRLPYDRVVARLGAVPLRKFIEACGVEFSGPSADALPRLSPSFESSVPGLYVVGALAGYPLIKHCINQGYDAIEHLVGAEVEPADEPLLLSRLEGLSGSSANARLEVLRRRIDLFSQVSPLQMREFMLDAHVRRFTRSSQKIIARNEIGSSLFAVVDGTVSIDPETRRPAALIELGVGEIFGEIGLISGRRRSATVRPGPGGALVVEIPRTAALKLMATVPAVKRAVDRVAIDRMLKILFGPGIPQANLDDITTSASLRLLKVGETLIEEDGVGQDVFLIRSGSLVVEKVISEKTVFLSYVPAGGYVGEMALFEGGRRTATVRATVATEVIVLSGARFQALLDAEPAIAARVQDQTAARREVNGFVEGRKAGFSSVVDMYSSVANFLLDEGLGEATDALLIDETLCIGCDNCEVACAEAHDGISRLDREAGRTYAHMHVPTSCRHCENPHCMTDCPPNAITRAADGEVLIDDSCIGCGACQRNCPYGVIQMQASPPKKPSLLAWLTLGLGPGPGQPSDAWIARRSRGKPQAAPVVAVKCDMCKEFDGGPACVRACPTGAALRVSPEAFLRVAHMGDAG